MQRNNRVFPLSVRRDLPSGFTSPMSIADSSVDGHFYCLSVSDGLKRPTSSQHFQLHVLSRLVVVLSYNNAIDFALGGQAMTSKPPSFVRPQG